MIGAEIRQAREAANISQLKFAERAGFSRSRLQDLENGENVRLMTLEKAIAQLPNLTRITLGGVEFVAVGRATAGANDAAGDHVHVSQITDPVTVARVAATDAAVAAGDVDRDADS